MNCKFDRPSRHLGRPFHADGFRSAAPPAFGLLVVGGSGVTAAEYERRRRGVPPFLAPVAEGLAQRFAFAFVHATAPYDVDFASDFDAPTLAPWCAHVHDELVPLFAELGAGEVPWLAAGHSGGMRLAAAAALGEARCMGAGYLGADGVPADLERPAAWRAPHLFVYNEGDRVFGRNEAALAALTSAGRASLVTGLPGSHGLADYVRNGALRRLVEHAAALATAGA